jgi:D-glycero-alpha-D-manno-heptose 1-phosphate guanylyltransferase
VTGFAAGGASGAGLINSGVYLLSPRLFEGHALPSAFSLEREFLPLAASEGRIAGFVTDGWFIDIGVPEDYDRAQTELPAQLAGLARR